MLLLGDRFYGQAGLIACCRRHGRDYRLRLEGNLRVFTEDGTESSVKELVPASAGKKSLSGERFFDGTANSDQYKYPAGTGT